MSSVTANIPAPWPPVVEKRPRKYLVYPLLAAIIGLYAIWVFSFYVPARSGTDQNGYMVTARLIAEHGRLSFVPGDPYQFVGLMMVMTPGPESRIYAKYPFGYPLLAAVCRVGGRIVGYFTHDPAAAIHGMYLVNPLCTILACLLSFFLFRRLVGNFTALLGVIWLACNPLTLAYANEANSHASTLLCVVTGFFFLLSWWEKGGTLRGFIGGFALGYACTIRYSEFLLVAPLLFVVLAKVKLDIRRFRQALPPLLGWAVPIAALAIVLWVGYGRPWRTGYDLCREQTGFKLKYFLGNSDPLQGTLVQSNWSRLMFQMNHLGLFMMMPLVIAGLIGLFWYSWRLATAIALWIVPTTVLYMFYYWGVGRETDTSYLRFFMTAVPGMLMVGLWALERALHSGYGAKALALGVLTCLACGTDVANILPSLESSQRNSLALRSMSDMIRQKFPPGQGNVVFADQESCNQLDAEGGYQLYDLSLLRPEAFVYYDKRLKADKSEEPDPVQTERSRLYCDLLGYQRKDGTMAARSQAEIDRVAEDLVDQAMGRGKKVAFVVRGDWHSNMIANRRDIRLVEHSEFEEPTPPQTNDALQLHWVGGVLQIPQAPRPLSAGQRRAQTWHFYTLEEIAPPGSRNPVLAGDAPR